jgi:cyclic pyranopterin monophosphate synthase
MQLSITFNGNLIMLDISHKQITLRTARAAGVVFCDAASVALIRNGQLPKGNLFDVARAAGLLGAKHTAHLLPHCHPVSIDGMELEFEWLESSVHDEILGGGGGRALGGAGVAGVGAAGAEVAGVEVAGVGAAGAEVAGVEVAGVGAAGVVARTGIVIRCEARSMGRTGIEMEALTAVSVAALEIYDMLKPVDKHLEIGHIRLLEKKGGKSDRERFVDVPPDCAVLVCSDSAYAGQRDDKSGVIIRDMLTAFDARVKYCVVVPDEKIAIQQQIRQWVSEDIHFIFTTGGTGLGPRDNTVGAVRELLDREAPGIAEAMRAYGQQRTPLAMMSQSVAGVVGQTLIVTLPGSSNGARESLEAILPAVFHARSMVKGGGH